MGGIVSSVLEGSIAEKVGIQAGDEVVSIDGHALRDVIDYRFYLAAEEVKVHAKRDGKEIAFQVEKSYDEELGLEFEQDLFDGVTTCDCHCIFCFIDQLPPGLRASLYLKDDDYRLSFLSGNFITLTNLQPEDWERIEKMRLSPLYVSVHVTDSVLRSRLLGNRRIPPVIEQLKMLVERKIEVHAQIVLCPGLNDGPVLEQTIRDLSSLFPGVKSVGIVPVGLTRFRQPRKNLPAVKAQLAEELVKKISSWQSQFRKIFGYPFVFAADEIYLLAGREFPSYRSYADFPQTENGVGLAACFLNDLRKFMRRRLNPPSLQYQSATLVTAQAPAGLLHKAARNISEKTGAEIWVKVVENSFFGPSVTVAGLLTGQDIVAALEGEKCGEMVIVPQAALNSEGAFLDGLSLPELSQRLSRPVAFANSPTSIAEILLGGSNLSG